MISHNSDFVKGYDLLERFVNNLSYLFPVYVSKVMNRLFYKVNKERRPKIEGNPPISCSPQAENISRNQ
jgi:hypothetical protein